MAARQLDRLPVMFRYGQALDVGVSRHEMRTLQDAGIIEAVGRGIYMRAGADELIDRDIAEIALKASHSTLCLTSALVCHDLSDNIPPAIDIAVPAGSHRPAVRPSVTWHRFDRSTFDIGRETQAVAKGISMGIYSAERCIIDAFRLRWLEGDDLAYIALRRWLRLAGSSPGKLLEMARSFPKVIPSVTVALQTLLYE
jgi:hypothetical protein